MAAQVIITGNYVEAAEHGISLGECQNSVVANNIIHQPGRLTDNTYDGIFCDDECQDTIIKGNHIRSQTFANQARYGINVSDAGAINNRIGDNDYGILADYATFPLNDVGAGTKYPTARTADLSVGGALSIGAGAALYPFAEDSIYIDAHPTAGTAPSGGPVTVDINKNGATSIYTTATNPSIASGTQVGSKAPGDQTIFAEDDYITLDLDAVNSAEDFTCVVRFLVT